MKTTLVTACIVVMMAPGAVADQLLMEPWMPAPIAFDFSPETPVVPSSGRASGGAIQPPAASDYGVSFHCPKRVQSDIEDTACPAFLLDSEDVMGQPILAVHPRNSDIMAFNALHGGPGIRLPTQQEAPSERSRSNDVHQPHTTFQTLDGGKFWQDNRYYSPLEGKAEVFGEDNAMSMDQAGNVAIGSLYAYRGTSDGPLGYAVALWNAGRADELIDYDRNYVIQYAQQPDYVIQDLHLVDSPGSGHTVAMWLEKDPDGRNAVEVRYLEQAEGGARWMRWGEGPRFCSGISNPIAVDGSIYIGCFANQHDPAVDVVQGQLQIHAIHPPSEAGANWTSERIGPAPAFATGNAVLASARGQGSGMVLAAAGAVDGRPFVQLSFGVAGTDWTAPKRYGNLISDAANRPTALAEAHVTALAYRPTTGAIHLLYLERYPGGEAEFHKAYAVIHHTGRFLGTWDVAYGTNRNVFAPQVTGGATGSFNDLHDSFALYQDRRGEDRLFVAFGDHGLVRFAEVREENPLLPGFPPIAPAAAAPAPVLAANPASVAVVAGTLSLAIVARMAMARHKKTVEAPAP